MQGSQPRGKSRVTSSAELGERERIVCAVPRETRVEDGRKNEKRCKSVGMGLPDATKRF